MGVRTLRRANRSVNRCDINHIALVGHLLQTTMFDQVTNWYRIEDGRLLG
jgi:hypothetical protein